MKLGTPGPHFHYDFRDPSVNMGTPPPPSLVGCLYSAEWNDGMEWWNGTMEWNGME